LTNGLKPEQVISEWIALYNTLRPHSALAGRTPVGAHGRDRLVDMMDKPNGLLTSPPAQQ
jgi:transposase InsO family protein